MVQHGPSTMGTFCPPPVRPLEHLGKAQQVPVLFPATQRDKLAVK